MTQLRLLLLSACLATAANAAAAQDCYADYKAKQNNPLRLHYGVAQLRSECSKAAATRELEGRLRSGGWVLLNVLSVFEASGLDQRKNDAGQFYLRY